MQYDGAKRWNNLGKDGKGCVTLDAFKHATLKWNAPQLYVFLLFTSYVF